MSVSCPDCGLALVEVPDFFGSPRLKHPDVECLPPRRSDAPMFTTASCAICDKRFPQRVRGWRRVTCSHGCLVEMQNRNLARGRSLLRPDHLKTPQASYRRAERTRKYWQRRADEMDAARTLAMASRMPQDARTPAEGSQGEAA